MSINDDTLAKLRMLRMWHCRSLLKCRAESKLYKGVSEHVITLANEAACHMSFIQTLNGLFPPGHPAEKEYEDFLSQLRDMGLKIEGIKRK